MTQISFPYTLADGQKAYASRLMANFNVLLNQINSGAGGVDITAISGVSGTTVQAVLEELSALIALRYTKAETNALMAQETSTLVKTLSINPTTGILTATLKDGTTVNSGQCLTRAGGTMTGALTLSGAPTAPLHAATKKYVDDKVLTDVPLGAKFTETTINGKTGAIAKSDITALGIPAQDTVYTHPATHSADMIVDGTANKAYTSAEKTKLAGISTGANKAQNSATNGNILIDGIETNIYTHPSGTNPHNTTKSDVGLSNVDNTSDTNKPISNATQTALNLKANLSSPAFTGTPTAPTATGGTNTTQVATTEFVQSALSGSGFITSSQAPVQSVAGKTGAVTLSPADVGAIPVTEKGASNGVATLDNLGKVPSAQLPTYPDISGKLDKSGGTMTGELMLNGAPFEDLHAVTKKFVEDKFNQVTTKIWTGTIAEYDALMIIDPDTVYFIKEN